MNRDSDTQSDAQPPRRHTQKGIWLLTWLIVAGLVLGAAVGELLYRGYSADVPGPILEGFYFVGTTFFMNLLKMILIPLVSSSVIVGVASLGDPAKLGRVGGFTVLYYLATMVIAVTLGVVLVTMIQPGANFDESFREQRIAEFQQREADTEQLIRENVERGPWGGVQNIADQLIPANPIAAAAEGQILPVIAFSLLLGIALMVTGRRARPVVDFFDALFAAVMTLVHWILWLAPLGVFCLVVWTVARIGAVSLVGPLAFYILTVLLGLALHGLVVLPLILWLLGRTNPYRYMHQMRTALMTAFGTDSSSATLPVTMEAAEEQGGVSKQTAGFVLPLGATINMDGTALYEAVAVVFLFQAFGIDLGGTELAIVVITATLAAVGAAGIPSAGLVTMVLVVEAVNDSLGLTGGQRLPLAAVGIILGVDRILDMCRTTVNVWGDATGAKVIDRFTTGTATTNPTPPDAYDEAEHMSRG